MTIIFQVFCALFSGILSALAIPNEFFHFGSTFIAFAALAPLYMAVKDSKSYKRTALLFAIDALACHLLSSYWLANFKDFAIFTLGASAIGTACIEAMAACIFYFPFANNKTSIYIGKTRVQNESFRILHFAFVRVIYEWAKSTGFLAYPWGVLSMAAFDNDILLQSADIFGSYGLTFIMAFGGGALGEALLLLQKSTSKGAFFGQKGYFSLICNTKCFLLMLSFATCYGTYKLGEFTPVQKTINAVLVQQNADPWASADDTESIKISMELSEKGIQDFISQNQTTDLVVWSEAVLRYAFPHSIKRYNFYPQEESLFSFINRMKTPFIIGGPYVIDASKRKLANAALVFDKNSNFKGYYAKSHLVPFAEVIPGVEYAWVRNWMDRMVGFSNGWTAGNFYALFDFSANLQDENQTVRVIDMETDTQEQEKRTKVRTAIPICFEDAFPDICGPFHQAGAELFMNITDDSWSKTKSAEYQHFAVARFRAVEYRTSLVRSTNAGFTVVVDNKGRILQSLPLFESGYLTAKIPIYQWRNTVYSCFNNWFPHLILLLTAFAAFFKALEFRGPSLKALVQKELLKIEF
ncbi:MAG: apolipoprotein N-acyltransferase [Clostridiales bacterium]|nr:apolipoprotein N-acyltransferase [Clostridiales bacterium]